MEEQVLVVPRGALPDGAGWHGLRTVGLDGFEKLVAREGSYRPRPAMEVDPTFKQIIPYLVLRDRFTIGGGGHLNPGDEGLAGGLRREWAEEVVADFEPDFDLIALLNDDTTEVGAVHLGAVYVADAAGRAVAIRETDKLTGSFVEPVQVAAVAERLETWSLLVFEALARQHGAADDSVTETVR